MTEETRVKLSLPELVEPPMKPYMNPFPPKGRVYDYKFVKEVSIYFTLVFKLSLAQFHDQGFTVSVNPNNCWPTFK